MRFATKKRAAAIRVYIKRRRAFIEANPWCVRCGGVATEIHHKAGRIGADLLDESKWVAMCHDDHRWATEHPADAIAQGYSLPRIGRVS